MVGALQAPLLLLRVLAKGCFWVWVGHNVSDVVVVCTGPALPSQQCRSSV